MPFLFVRSACRSGILSGLAVEPAMEGAGPIMIGTIGRVYGFEYAAVEGWGERCEAASEALVAWSWKVQPFMLSGARCCVTVLRSFDRLAPHCSVAFEKFALRRLLLVGVCVSVSTFICPTPASVREVVKDPTRDALSQS